MRVHSAKKNLTCWYWTRKKTTPLTFTAKLRITHADGYRQRIDCHGSETVESEFMRAKTEAVVNVQGTATSTPYGALCDDEPQNIYQTNWENTFWTKTKHQRKQKRNIHLTDSVWLRKVQASPDVACPCGAVKWQAYNAQQLVWNNDHEAHPFR